MSTQETKSYKQMWEDFGASKGDAYLNYKFLPTHRVGLTNHVREELILRLLKPKNTDCVLDIGCASGRQLFKIAHKIKEGVGTDIAESFVKAAEENIRSMGTTNLSFNQAVLEKLPFEDNSFDKLICAEVLEHVHDKNVAIDELVRVVNKDGLIIISTPLLNADGTWWGRLLRLFGIRKFISLEHFSTEELVKHGDAHVREFTGGTMKQWLETKRLNVIAIRYASYFDGPYCDSIIKEPRHMPGLQQLIVFIEKMLTRTRIPLARHVVMVARKV